MRDRCPQDVLLEAIQLPVSSLDGLCTNHVPEAVHRGLLASLLVCLRAAPVQPMSDASRFVTASGPVAGVAHSQR